MWRVVVVVVVMPGIARGGGALADGLLPGPRAPRRDAQDTHPAEPHVRSEEQLV